MSQSNLCQGNREHFRPGPCSRRFSGGYRAMNEGKAMRVMAGLEGRILEGGTREFQDRIRRPEGISRPSGRRKSPLEADRQGMKQPNSSKVTVAGADELPASSTAMTAKVFDPLTMPYSNTWV